jgi:hypothetical protein
MENPVPLEEVAAHIDALVARDAAERLEQLIAGQLLRRDRGGSPASQRSNLLPGVTRERS